jgi:cytochrome oxidase Cu insertion factor (SCO1/SenC/PrrC family)
MQIPRAMGWFGATAVATLAVLAVLGAVPVEARRATEVPGLLHSLRLAAPSRPVPAPPFELADLGGTPVRLQDHAGRVVILYFWTTW